MAALKKAIAYVGDTSWKIDGPGADARIKAINPHILQQDETIELAFGSRGGFGRDSSYLTNKRVLIKAVKGLCKCIGLSDDYLSIPYSTIKAYSVDTPALLDNDVTLKIWSSGLGCTEKNFAAGGVDILAIMRTLNAFVLPGGSGKADLGSDPAALEEEYAGGDAEGKKGGLMDLIGGDARQIKPSEVEPGLKAAPTKVLLDEEKVEMAFKAGRDTTLLTSHRMLIIDVQGLTGKKVCYTSVLWRAARAFEVETAGSLLDRDCTMAIFTSINDPKLKKLETELAKDKVDLLAIQRFFCDKILGMDTMAPSEADMEVPEEGEKDKGGGLFAWLGDDARAIDPTQIDQKFHENPRVLQGTERVEMAFKGRKDLLLFTNKRILIVDYSGLISKKTKYLSFPWTTIKAFAVRTAGSMLDKDSELMLWTDIMHDWEEQGDDQPPIAVVGMSYMEQDFQKDSVDLIGVHNYLSERVMASAGGDLQPDLEVNADIMNAAQNSGGMEKFLSWLGGDASAIDHNMMTEQLREMRLIDGEESCLMALRCGKDTTCFTTKRILFLDHQREGLSKKMEYKSVPYTSVRGFEVESAGGFDSDAEATIWIKNYWDMSSISQDMRKGKADIIALQNLLAKATMGNDDGGSGLEQAGGAQEVNEEGGFASFMSMLKDDSAQINSSTADDILRKNPKILMDDEKVDMAFRCGRDMIVYTTKRLLMVDVKGWSGKKVAYTSVPFKHMNAYRITTAGSCLDSDSEAVLYTDVPEMTAFHTQMKKDKVGGIYDLMSLLNTKRLA